MPSRSSKGVHANTQLTSNEFQKTRSLKKVRKLVQNIGEVSQPKEMVEGNSGKDWSSFSRMGSLKRQSITSSLPATLPLVPHLRSLSLQRTHLFSSPDMPSKYPPTSSRTSLTSVDIDEQSVVSSSSFTYPIPDLEQLQKDRVAKLSRHLGENVPPELVSRHVRDDATIPSGEKHKRRQSLDLTLAPGYLSVKPSLEKMEGAKLKRSRSLWARKGHTDDLETAAEFQKRYDRNFGLHRSMSERQRLLNVKRARKMTQVFGQEPPQELIQIVDEDERLPTLNQVNRDSMSTLFSFSSNPISPTSILPVLPLRYSTSNLSDPPAISIAPECQPPPSPPPFVSAVEVDLSFASQESQPPIEDALATFGERRRRAAKLSRFFGVKYKDLESYTPPTQDPKPQVSEPSGVDVQVIGRSRFWGDRVSVRDAQLADVIDQLRELKAG